MVVCIMFLFVSGMAFDRFPHRLQHRPGLLGICYRWQPYHEVGRSCYGPISDQIHLQCLADHVVRLHDC